MYKDNKANQMVPLIGYQLDNHLSVANVSYLLLRQLELLKHMKVTQCFIQYEPKSAKETGERLLWRAIFPWSSIEPEVFLQPIPNLVASIKNAGL